MPVYPSSQRRTSDNGEDDPTKAKNQQKRCEHIEPDLNPNAPAGRDGQKGIPGCRPLADTYQTAGEGIMKKMNGSSRKIVSEKYEDVLTDQRHCGDSAGNKCRHVTLLDQGRPCSLERHTTDDGRERNDHVERREAQISVDPEEASPAVMKRVLLKNHHRHVEAEDNEKCLDRNQAFNHPEAEQPSSMSDGNRHRQDETDHPHANRTFGIAADMAIPPARTERLYPAFTIKRLSVTSRP